METAGLWMPGVFLAISSMLVFACLPLAGRFKKRERWSKALVVANDQELRRALDAACRTSELTVISSRTLKEGIEDSLGRWKVLPRVIFFTNPYDNPSGISVLCKEVGEVGREILWGRTVKSVVVSLREGDDDKGYLGVKQAALETGFDECMGRSSSSRGKEVIAPEEMRRVLRNLGL